MDLTPYVSALRDDLAAAAAVGDEATSRAGSTLAAALEPAVRLALMNALSDLAGEIDAALPDHRVALRLRGRELDVAVEADGRNGRDGAEGRDGRDGRDRTDRDPEPAPAGGGFFAGPSSSPFAGPDGARRGGSGFPGGPGFPGFPGAPGPGGFGEPDVGDISRMTLRIVDQIKGQAERAAAAQGMSLNSWVSQAVQGALRSYGGGDHGGGRSGRSQWSNGRPADEGTPPGDGPARPAEDPAGGSTPGSSGTPGSTDPTRDDRPGDRPGGPDDGPGDGGVQGWVRG